MAIARKIAYNVVFSSVAKVFSTILALVAIGFITRYLGAEGFGNYATVLAFLSFFAAITDLGLNQISTREISRTGADEKKIIGNIFCLRALSSLTIIIIAPVTVFFLNYPLEVKKGILIVAVSFLFSSTYQILNGVFQKNLAMDKVALGELMGKIVQVAFVILAVRLELGFDWIMAALLFNSIASFLVVFFWSKKYLRFKLQVDFKYWKEFLKESMPLGISAVITFIYFKMDTLILASLKGSADVGIYNAAYKVLENITFFPAMIVGLVLPILARNVFENRERFTDIANKTFKVFVILVVPLVVGTLFLADGVINIIGGEEFAQAGNVLRILVFALAFIFFGQLFNAVLVVSNLQKKLMIILAIAAVVNISLNLIFIPKFSYMAAAYVSLITEIVVVSLGLYLSVRKAKFIPVPERIFSILLAGSMMGLFLYLFRGYTLISPEINFVFLSVGSAGIYFFFLWVFRAIKTEEIKSLINKKGIENYEELS